jgi:hypothetical protein
LAIISLPFFSLESKLGHYLETGNSPKVVKDHYFEIVDERAAGECWSIKPLPKGDRTIVAMS